MAEGSGGGTCSSPPGRHVRGYCQFNSSTGYIKNKLFCLPQVTISNTCSVYFIIYKCTILCEWSLISASEGKCKTAREIARLLTFARAYILTTRSLNAYYRYLNSEWLLVTFSLPWDLTKNRREVSVPGALVVSKVHLWFFQANGRYQKLCFG